MRKKRLVWRLYSYYLLITLLALVAMAWYASSSLKDFYLEETSANLKEKAYLANRLFGNISQADDIRLIDETCKKAGKNTSTRITVITPSGRVLGDSEEDPARMNNHSDRPEIIKALAGDTGVSTRYSATLKRYMMYVAIPIEKEGEITSVLRTSMPVMDISQALNNIRYEIAFGVFIAAILGALLSFILAYRINKPLQAMKEGAVRFASGNLDFRLRVPDSDEMGSLAVVMNEMAAQLDDRIKAVTRKKNELEAVLSSMVEAVIVVDGDEHVLQLNSACVKLFQINPPEYEGRSIQEVIRNTTLYAFVKQVLESGESIEGDIVLQEGGEKFLNIHGAALMDMQQNKIGAVLVLHDVTRLKKLENIRRDFVANVSHELKTPITSIKGFVETLRDGAIDNREDTKNFLEKISKHTDRLNAIIEDLLSLSRIERDTETEQIGLEEEKIKTALDNAILLCQTRADDKHIKIKLECTDDITVKINRSLLEQAVANLIDNSIKYSDSEKDVIIEGLAENNSIIIKVTDSGYGIPKEHLPRIFERFYRVDKSRSRKLGGTGLGLAIAKHIVHAHDGDIKVESEPGKGSIFTINLPKT